MRAVATPPDHDHLFAIAESQDGYFTMAQALEAGFARSTHSYHVKEGNWLREHRGIYRLRQYPQAENGQLVLWSLWSRDRHGEPQGVYSHTTALALRDLSDANPSKLHMTVPPSFRRNSEMPAILVLHKSRLAFRPAVRTRKPDVRCWGNHTISYCTADFCTEEIVCNARGIGVFAERVHFARCWMADILSGEASLFKWRGTKCPQSDSRQNVSAPHHA